MEQIIMEDSKVTEKSIKEILDHWTAQIDFWDFYKTMLEGDWLITYIFEQYIREVEGWTCCADKALFIVNQLHKANLEKEELPLQITYREYQANGGDIGNIKDLDYICYWCPKSLKTTKEARDLLLLIPKEFAKNLVNKVKEKKNNEEK